MGLFSKKKGTDMASVKEYDRRSISYVVERFGSEEKVIGRGGAVSADDEKFVVMCDGREVVRLSSVGMICAELMSHNGADIKGLDMETGEPRHIVIHYASRR